jgi:hypothetical protein
MNGKVWCTVAKVTKRDNFVAIADILEGIDGASDLVDFIDAQIAMLDKRKGAERKMTAVQLANVALKSDIVEVLTEVGSATATDVGATLDISVQKASQLLRQLTLDGEIVRTEGKGKEKTTFAVA